jgi:rhodanese-related sulfurtransferase
MSFSLQDPLHEPRQPMTIIDIFKQADEDKKDIQNLSIAELKNEMEQNDDLLLLDIREVQELVDLGTIPGAIHCARGMMEFWASPASPYFRDYFQESRRTILFCAGGGRSVFATKALQAMGYTNVAHLEAGFSGWTKDNEEIHDYAKSSKWIRRPE